MQRIWMLCRPAEDCQSAKGAPTGAGTMLILRLTREARTVPIIIAPTDPEVACDF
jgi:hypothetical protein